MTKSIYNIISLITLLLIYSCHKKWLDEKTDIKLAVPTTLNDFQALMDDANLLNANSISFCEIAVDGFSVTSSTFNSGGPSSRNAYTWSHNEPYSSVTDWRNAFKKIFVCNLVIEEIEKLHPKDTYEAELKSNILGQALFQRAFTFYEIAQIWAPPYSENADTLLGIPLRTSSDLNINSNRSSLEITYEQILADLNQAKNLLPQNSLIKTRGSKHAVYALLARINLDLEEFSTALQFSDSCLQINSSLLNFNEIDSTPSFPLPTMNNNVEVIFHKTILSTSFLSSSLVSDSIYALYKPNDLRRALYFRKNSNSTITYRGSYSKNILLFNGLSTDELYLIKAECLARKGDHNSAMNVLNALLGKRWKAGLFQPLFAGNSEDALIQILNERRRELIRRGVRWTDLRRLNKDSRFKVTLSRVIGGNTFTLTPSDYNYTFPIPDDVIQQTGMVQNIGWQ